MSETQYDGLLSSVSKLDALYYGLPAVALLGCIYWAGVPDHWWTPALIIYAIAAFSHSLSRGFMGANIQLKVISDYWEKKMKDNNY